MHSFDTLIKDGIVIDGGRTPRYRADIGIRAGRIAKIGRLKTGDAARIIDARGLMVVPGFVDLHTHYDAQLFWDPYCSISGWHGVTSVVIGNCGFGFAPVRPDGRERAMLTMTRVEAIPYASMKAGLPWDWTTFPEFLDRLDRQRKGINLLPYVPAGPLLIWVMGIEAAKTRQPTAAEEAEICRLLNEAMDAGGCGWSAQRLLPDGPASVQRDYDGSPMVTDVMSDETCLALARVLAERNEGFVQLTLASADIEHDRHHCEQLAEISGRPILFNVVASDARNPQAHRDAIAWLERCRSKGIRVYGQGVTGDAGFTFKLDNWNMFDECEAWRDITLGSPQERLNKMTDPKRRETLRNNIPTLICPYFDKIIVTGVEREDLKSLEGLTLGEIAETQGKHIVDAMLDLAVDDSLNAEFYGPASTADPNLLREIYAYDFIIPGVSDGGAHTKFFVGGRYPTETLTGAVREHEMLSLEEAHWRLSALPAWCAGFRERGILREGAPADIVVYDYDNLKLRPIEIARDFPGNEWRRVQRAEGYRYILVNGEVTFADGQATGATPGRLLRHGA